MDEIRNINISDKNMISTKKINRKVFYQKLKKYRQLFLMLIPCLIYYIIFQYGPIYGVIIAFKDFNFIEGILGSSWVGLKHFISMFRGYSFPIVFRNTLILGFLKLLIGFPIPIIFAILLNEIRIRRYKKVVQTVSYLPHFLSWVILGGIFFQFFSIHGPINHIMEILGINKIPFLTHPQWFRVMLIVTYIWKSIGWSSIVYLAAITSIPLQLYEAATIDGANRFQRMYHITFPSLLPVITIMFILASGRIIKDDFNQIFNLYNPAVYETADVISTYVYRQGLERMRYSYSTAVNLFKNVIAFGLVFTTNKISQKINEYGIW